MPGSIQYTFKKEGRKLKALEMIEESSFHDLSLFCMVL